MQGRQSKQIVRLTNRKREIESLCLKLLLHQQPVASDLRMVSSALKMVTDMERIGDHAADISEITICLAKNDKNVNLKVLHEMAKETTVMLVGSIDAYVDKGSRIGTKRCLNMMILWTVCS